MAQTSDEEKSRWDVLLDNFELLCKRMNDIGTSQSDLKTQLQETNRKVDAFSTKQNFMSDQVKANGAAVAQLTLREIREENRTRAPSSPSVLSAYYDDDTQFENVFADPRGKGRLRETRPSTSRQHRSHRRNTREDTQERENHHTRGPREDTHHRDHQTRDQLPHHTLPKMQFPHFAGDNPRIWIHKCNNYFKMYSIHDTLKVTAATMHLDDNPAKWWEAYSLTHADITWEQFCAAILTKFGADDYRSAMVDLIALKQAGSVDDYTSAFQALQYSITMHSGQFDELYFAQQYVAGLRDDIRAVVEPQLPTTVEKAALIAQMQQRVLDRAKSKFTRSQSMTRTQPGKSDQKQNLQSGSLWQDRQLRDYRRAHNLSFHCGAKFEPGHLDVCPKKNKPQVNALVANDLDRELSDEVLNELAIDDALVDDMCQLSINALAGTESNACIKLKATVQSKTMLILVDTGSTHSFVNSNFVQLTKLPTAAFPAHSANLSGFSCLYSLSLCNVRVDDEGLLSIMSSCSALRNLCLRSCHKLIELRVSHAQLVDLEVYSCGRLRSVSIHAEKLQSFSYKGRRVDIEYDCVPVLSKLGAYFGCLQHTLDLLEKFPNKLKMLTLLFPSRMQASRILQHNGRFAILKEITLCIMHQSWKKSIRIVALILQSAPLVQTLNLEVHGNLRPLNMLRIRWPKNLTAASLRTIRIVGFTGEPELVQLLLFLLRRSPVLKTLLIDTQVRHSVPCTWKIDRSKDAMRGNYGREVAQKLLSPNVPCTVKLSVM